jgi:hypothetical protein
MQNPLLFFVGMFLFGAVLGGAATIADYLTGVDLYLYYTAAQVKAHTFYWFLVGVLFTLALRWALKLLR